MPLNYPQIKDYLNYYLQLKKIHSRVFFIGPHIEPNIKIDIHVYDKINKPHLMKKNANFDILEVDNFLKKIDKINNIKINYISKIDLIKYDYKNDFIRNNKLMFSDGDHWSKSGELYFGKKLFSHIELKNLIE